MSIGFVARTWTDGDPKVFTEAEILEATLTPQPANPEARIIEVKASSEHWARMRQHLRNSHAGISAVDTSNWLWGLAPWPSLSCCEQVSEAQSKSADGIP